MGKQPIDLQKVDFKKMGLFLGVAPQKIKDILSPPTLKHGVLSLIEEAKTINQIREAWEKTRTNSPEEKQAMLKWIDLCQTPDQIREAWKKTRANSSERKQILLKMIPFFTKS